MVFFEYIILTLDFWLERERERERESFSDTRGDEEEPARSWAVSSTD
jgi:hypothetical protein